MIRSAWLLTGIVACSVCFSHTLMAQDSLETTVPDSVQADSVLSQKPFPDTTKVEVEPEPVPEGIVPWTRSEIILTEVTNDSLLRWEIWPNWGDYYAYRRDVISYRQGTVGRVDAFDIAGFEPYEQFLSLEGIDLRDPLTGYVNYNYVPNLKIGKVLESNYGSYHSEVRMKQYHILAPISYLNYDEAKYNYRNLEFMVTQNFTERTNLEISFWDRRDGDSYPNNEVNGNQIVLRGYHYLNNKYQLRTVFIRNQFDSDESFGYSYSDSVAFPFDKFTAPSRVNGRGSNKLRRDFIVGLYHRKDTSGVEDTGIELSNTKNEFGLSYPSDTLSWELSGLKARAFKRIGTKALGLTADGSWSYFNFRKSRSFSLDNWNIAELNTQFYFQPVAGVEVNAVGSFKSRSDGFTGYDAGVGLSLNPIEQMRVYGNATVFSRIPTIQALYWQSLVIQGNPDLENEEGISVFGAADLNAGDYVKFGIKGRWKQATSGTYLIPDSTFTNSDDYSLLSGTVYGKFENRLFEFESSATVQGLNNQIPSSELEANNLNNRRLWIRNSGFVKGYVFDRAAYLKMGLKTILSPQYYGSRLFVTGAQYWQANSYTESDIPSFFRMDAELSARVRGIMVVIRWENLLDGFGQAGYFEAATFPMPQRRLIVGIRAQFRN